MANVGSDVDVICLFFSVIASLMSDSVIYDFWFKYNRGITISE